MSDDNDNDNDDGSGCCGSFSIGSFIAILLSWTTHGSVLWAFFHAMCGWLYVIYWLFVYWE